MTDLRKKLFGKRKYINKKFGPLRIVYGQGSGHPFTGTGKIFYCADLTIYLGDYVIVFIIPELQNSYIHKF